MWIHYSTPYFIWRSMTLITKWYDKKDERSRYFMGYVARIFAIDCYCWCFDAFAVIVIAVYLGGVFVASVIVLPRSVLRHFVPPCIAVESARQWVRSIREERLNFKSEELFVPNGHITLHTLYPFAPPSGNALELRNWSQSGIII